MLHRIAATIAATAAAVLLASSPAWAEGGWTPPLPSGSPLPAVPFPGEQHDPPADCVGEPFEIAPGEWDCLVEPVPSDVPTWDDGNDGWSDDGATPAPEEIQPAPEPAPVVIVVGDGDWGWSDARDLYAS